MHGAVHGVVRRRTATSSPTRSAAPLSHVGAHAERTPIAPERALAVGL